MKEKTEEKIGKVLENRQINFLYRTYLLFSEHKMKVYSGYAALYILMAMIPLLMLIIFFINRFSPIGVDTFIDTLTGFMGDLPEVQDMIRETVYNLNAQSSGLVASLSALTTLWSASNGVSAIQLGLDELHDTGITTMRGKPKALIYTIVFIVSMPAIMVLQLMKNPLISLVTGILEYLNLSGAARAFASVMQYSYIMSFVLFVLLVLLVYTYLPGGKHSLRSQFPGALLACVGTIIFSTAFGFFMGTFWKASAFYGSLAAIFLSAMWLRYEMAIIFFGASFNEVLYRDTQSGEGEDLHD